MKGKKVHLEIEQAYKDISAANSRLEKAVLSELSEGSPVMWAKSRSEQYGYVVRCVGDRVEVCNDKTGTRQLVHAFWFLPEYGGQIFTPNT